MIRSAVAVIAMLSALFAAALLLVSPAVADPSRTCAPRDEIVKLLSDGYGETTSGTGLSESGDAAFEMFRSREGTWTITMTTTNGLTCVMAAGREWRDAKKVAKLPRT